MSKSCTYTFKGPDGKEVSLAGMPAMKAYLATGGLEFLLGEARADLARASANDGPDGILRSAARSVTETEAFKRWSNGNPVVFAEDASKHAFQTGTPVVVDGFHGSRRSFDRVDPAEASAGYFLSNNPFVADEYAGVMAGRPSEIRIGGNVQRQFVRMDNPLVINARGASFNRIDTRAVPGYPLPMSNTDAINQWAREQGYDGVIYKDLRDSMSSPDGRNAPASMVYGTFKPNFVKSVIGNDKTFDLEEESFLSSRDRVTETPEFKAWFRDSKVVDENGEPLVVYHGTDKDFSAFDPERIGNNFGVDEEGFFFTDSTIRASGYADSASEFAAAGMGVDRRAEPRPGGNVMPVYLSIKNPLTIEAYTDSFYTNPSVEIDEQGISLTDYFDDNRKSIMEFVKRGGHDGVLFQHKGKTLAVALRPEQIKSAIGNSGAFDPTNPDITKSGDREITIDLSSERAKEKPARDWIRKVYEGLPRNPLNPSQRAMMFGDEEFALIELGTSGINPGGVEIKWIQAYPHRSGVGSKAIRELQRLAAEDNIALDLWPWDKGRVSQADLIKFYKSVGFEPTGRGSKHMIWRPEGISRSVDRPQTVEDVSKMADGLGVRLNAVEGPQDIELSLIQRGEGAEPGSGRRVMQALIDYADRVAKPIFLDVKGGSGRLGDYYAEFGFEPYEPTDEERDDGRDWDYGMVRQPERPDTLRSVDRDPRDNPNFVRWFSDSVMTESGRPGGVPLVLYHGGFDFANAPAGKAVPKTGNRGALGVGFYLTPDESRAAEYADENSGAVTQAYVRMLRPLEIRITAGQDPMIEALVSLGMDREKAARKVETAYEKYGYVGSEVKGLALNEGYDGLVEYIDGRMSEVVAWAPTQIKSATDNDGDFSWNPDIRKSVERSPLGFYSALAKGIEGLPTKQAPAGAWKAAIKGLVNKGAAKADEVEWSGINDWLDLQQGKVSKDRVSEYLKQGGVRVEETMLGDNAPHNEFDSISDARKFMMDHHGQTRKEFDDDYEGWSDQQIIDSANDLFRDAYPDSAVPTKYSQYTLPGGENYREVLLTMPLVTRPATRSQWIRAGSEGRISADEFDRGVEDESLRTLPVVGANYKSKHWDQPNVLAHIRVNDRTDADGSRVLFVEELQSDFGQDAKKKGIVRSYRPEEVQPIGAVEAGFMTRADEELFWFFKTPDNTFQIPKSKYPNREDARDYIVREKKINSNGVPSAPFINKTEGWLNLALKRVIIMAAEGGYEKVAFVNGEQSAERYDLSKQVNYIQWNPGYDGVRKLVQLEPTDGETIGFTVLQDGTIDDSTRGWDGKQLDEVIGKELATKIMASERGDLRGLDLKVGGSGMKTFYDTIVPTALKKLLPKVGGGQMGTVRLGDGAKGTFWADGPQEGGSWSLLEGEDGAIVERGLTRSAAEAAANQRNGVGLEQPGFDVTEAMRDKVSEGLPLFSRDRGWAGFPDAVIAAPLSLQTKDASYQAAKSGDLAAATDLVARVLPADATDKVRAMIGDTKPVVVPVSAEEAAGRNKIPLATAVEIASRLGLEVDTEIVQSTRSRRSGGDGMARLASQPGFAGEVRSGQDYLIVDDTLTQGGTLAQLKTHIERSGGRVVGAFALGGKQYSAKMALDDETLSKVRASYGEIEDWWRDNVGFGFAGLTESEARYILKSGLSPDALRDRVAAQRDARGTGEGEVAASRERLTDTPEFRRWFGNSRVVDESGKPLVVYHQTKGDFSTFIPGGSDPKLSGPAIWARPDPSKMMSGHNTGTNRKGKFQPGSLDMPLYVRIENALGSSDANWREVYGQFKDKGNSPWTLTPEFVAELKQAGYDGIMHFDKSGELQEIAAFDPTQVKSAIGNSGAFDPANPDITKSEDRDDRATSAWQSPSASKFDNWVYKLQDKQIDTKRVVDEIRDVSGALADDLDVYLQEELFHGRAAKRTEDFVNKELRPLVDAMAKDGLKIEDLDTFLHARHAREANAVIAQRNPEIQDGGSGMTNQDAADYFANLDEAQRRKLEAAAAKVDAIIAETRKMMVDYQLESPDVIKGWGEMFQHYVPLMREDEGAGAGVGIGQGFSIKGREVKSRTGSTRKVVDIFANIAMQRERTIVRGEKNRVSQALHGLAAANPNPDFWRVDQTPTTPTFNPSTGLVEDRPDPMFKTRENVIVSKVLEQDDSGRVVVREKAVIFDEKNERAMRMATALKNLDAAQLEGLMGASAAVTRYFASINTQYNPVFGIINLMRDVQGAIVNLNTTELKDDKWKVAKGSMSALIGIMSDARKARRGEAGTSEWAALWEDFQEVGGQTGYRQLFQTSADRAKDIEKALNPDAWMDSKLGRIFTANGTLKVPLSVAMKGARWLFDLLSDYNLAMENAIRLSAYKAALDRGMSRERAASLAKNLTVNFNRRGQVGQQAGALYAFFNASMQGTARLGKVLFEMEPGKPKTIRLSALGKKIVYGGMLLGTAQAFALALAGFSDDDPPDFVRERSLVFPTGWTGIGSERGYISIPMPLGLHVIPTIGRVTTEWALSGFKNTPQRVASLLGTFADSFNPIGNAGWSMQTLAPTALDPLVALTENRDWQGRPIAKESMNRDMPGPLLYRDTATSWGKVISESINYLSGGDKYTRGVLSPTPDQIDYLIGQLTGGVGREISKIEQTAVGLARGEEVPTYKIPLVGRLIGDSKSQASEGTAFYANAQKLNKLETEIKLLREDGKTAEAQALRASRPEAYLITQANYAERAIQRLRKEKSELIKEGAPRERVREIEEKITARMAGLNRAMEALEAAR